MAFFEGFSLERVGGLRARVGGSGRRSCCCTGIRARTPRGTGSRRASPTASRWSAPTCPATGSRARPTGPSARWRERSRGRWASSGSSEYAAVGHDRGVLRRASAGLDHGVTRLVGAGRRADRRGARALRRALRGELVALVLLRADGQARGGLDRARPAGLVPRRPGGDGRREPRGLAARGHRPGGDPRDGRRVPRRRAGRPLPRGLRPRRRAAACTCPTLFAWSACTTTWRSSTATRWRSGAPGSTGRCAGARIDSGHHMAEEAPEQLADVLTEFLCASSS